MGKCGRDSVSGATILNRVIAEVHAVGEFKDECKRAFEARETVKLKGANWFVVSISNHVDQYANSNGEVRMYNNGECTVGLQLA